MNGHGQVRRRAATRSVKATVGTNTVIWHSHDVWKDLIRIDARRTKDIRSGLPLTPAAHFTTTAGGLRARGWRVLVASAGPSATADVQGELFGGDAA